MKIDTSIIEILDRSEIRDVRLLLPDRLDRAAYTRVNKVLTAAGAKWNRAMQAHVFQDDAREIVETMILTGTVVSVKQAFGYFATTPQVLAVLLAEAEIQPGQRMLEPSAGCGVLARAGLAAGARVDCVEIRHDAAVALHQSGLYADVQCDDFMTLPVRPVYDRVLMNPPFGNQADLRHVRRAYDWLAPGGRLVTVMASGVTQRENRLSVEFRDFVAAQGGRFAPLPENAFRASGTDVRTVTLVLDRP